MDAVKFSIPFYYWEILSTNSKLKWHWTVDNHGEIEKATAYYNHINFIYQKPRYSTDKSLREIRLEFSFSCVLNDGYNYLDPSIYQLQSLINYIHYEFKINPFDAKIHFIEFGCTIPSPVKYSLIENSLIAFGYKMFNSMLKQGTQTKIGNKCTMSQMEFKIYGKHLKYPELSLQDLLRIEVKAFKMDFLKLGYTLTLGNLLDSSTLNRFREILTVEMKQVVFNDLNRESTLSKPQKRLIADWSNPKYIEVLSKNNPSKYRKEKQKYLKLIPINSVWNQIQAQILYKWDSLLIEDQKKGTDLTIQEMTFANKNGTNLTYMIGNSNNTNPTNSIQDLEPIPEPSESKAKKRFCKVTRFDISHQSDKSIFLSDKSIRIIYQKDSIKFEWLLKEFFPESEFEPINQICDTIAHRIRNRDSDMRRAINNRKIKYKSSLFPFEYENQINFQITQKKPYICQKEST